jgi:SARP family transcriptional regulator, regulator of embCAB operon
LRYEILGSLRVADAEGVRSIGARKMEIVLVTLLARANLVVPTDCLIRELWNDNPPARASAALHVYISQLRKFLRTDRSQSPITTKSAGYQLDLNTGELDLHVFQRLLQAGRSHLSAGEHALASEAFDSAISLWRGRALPELREGPIIAGFTGWLEELRLECVELAVSSALHLGRHRAIVGWLQSLVAENPLHEVFYEKLMLALHRSGRRAEALNVYRQARDTLHTELGIEPSTALRRIQMSILSPNDELAASQAV